MRIQIEIDETGSQVLDRIKQSTGVNTYKDIFNNAITLFEWAIRQREEGRVMSHASLHVRQQIGATSLTDYWPLVSLILVALWQRLPS